MAHRPGHPRPDPAHSDPTLLPTIAPGIDPPRRPPRRSLPLALAGQPPPLEAAKGASLIPTHSYDRTPAPEKSLPLRLVPESRQLHALAKLPIPAVVIPIVGVLIPPNLDKSRIAIDGDRSSVEPERAHLLLASDPRGE